MDRYGNRTIHQTNTWGTGINKKDFTVSTASNRLGVPGGQSGTMTYDNAGNLTNDTYTGAGSRAYDAETRMTQAFGGANQQQFYTYNADGQRVRRKIDGVETWQIYGMDGELLAEYAANAAAGSPQKEYGYRNGQLLVTAEAPAGINVALAANGATATASSSYTGYAASGAINGDRKGVGGGQNGYWNSAAAGFPSWLEVNFNGSKSISEIDVFTVQDNYSNPSEPTETMTFSLYGLSGYEVQYWNGSAWATVTGGSVTGNNKVWRRFNFSAISTTKIRVLTNAAPDNWSRLTEVEAWSGTSSANINWLVADQLGTPRMVIDKTGSLANVKRHDYLPFGEELVALQGVRTTGLGYIADTIRQKFTSYERDGETQLDYAQARYYSSQQGRFTSVDPLMASASTGDPQTFNRYTYALNSPANVTDPSGMLSMNATSACGNGCPNSDKNDSGGWGGAFTAGGIEKTPETQIQANIRIWNAIVRALEQAFPSQNSTASCGCTLKVRGKAGKQLSPGNPLRFPGRNQKLGPNGSSFYWGWQIEETGTVSDDVSTWTISRVWEDRSTVTYEDGTSETYTKSGFEDANRVYQPKGGHRFYSLDAPGFKKLQLLYANVRSASNVTNFTTYLHKGNIVREARWSISMTYTNGRLPLADFKPHHVQLK